ncbi:uncharacterized protein PV06_04252 [Exophiala oligosperma]|uniref:FRG1-like family protein n=2 Tax=Chaetothyriales TaxID=34395 RepID=A0A0D2DJF4_9EURO|nr:uncharacterized protein PV06_04252 [Exophiala oligosperma]KAJ9636135.1 hypothetical protein H2204_005407 [Knufia peltigerae]KIW43108.1 hypothetical protein PV06_04252 [Exophiala oligosperma]
MPVKPLSFKGDKKPSKKRKHQHETSSALVSTSGDVTTTDPQEDTTWTTPDAATDLSGPTILVLSTSPPTVLSSDAHGNVFASPLENIVESVPETAEPHDVRQVWVASSVAGTGQISLKASHGGYLSCDGIGVLGARREARGHEEGFVVEQFTTADTNKTRWRLRTAASKPADGEQGRRYISAVTETQTTTSSKTADDDDGGKKKRVSISLRGDGDAASENTHLVIKMQARFKPQIQQKKETKAKEKISRRELEQAVGRTLEDDEVKRLKRAKKEGTYYEEVLDVRVKGKHDKFAS